MSEFIYVFIVQLYFLHPSVRGECLRGVVGKVGKRVSRLTRFKSVHISGNMALNVFYDIVVHVLNFDIKVSTRYVFPFSEVVIDELILLFELKFAINLA